MMKVYQKDHIEKKRNNIMNSLNKRKLFSVNI